MRTNMPVTNNEYVLKATDMVVSKTDTRGLITYVNSDFLRISGFNEKELIGQPHNIVRHPDMPEEAFADLWDTLKAGKPWTGLVKNRCKNGDFYWVVANATPIRESGQVTGYMSVRSAPSRAQIQAAEGAYRLFKEGKQGNLKIREGSAVKGGWQGALAKLKGMSIRARLTLMSVIMAAAVVLAGGAGLWGMSGANNDLKIVYEEHTVMVKQLKTIADAYAVSIIDAVNKANAGLISAEEASKGIIQAQASIKKEWQSIRSAELTSEEAKLANIADAQFKVADEEVGKLQRRLSGLSGNVAGKLGDFDGPLYKSIDPASDTVGQLIERQLKETELVEKAALARFASTRNVIVTILLLGLGFAGLIAYFTYRAIQLPLQRLRGQMLEIAQGNMGLTIVKDRNDEIGAVSDAFKSMFVKLGFEVAETKRIADENLRIKIALDNVSTNVMIADNDRNIIYMNTSVHKLMQGVEADLRKVLPNFNAATLLGSNIDQFHKNPAHQKSMLATFTATHRVEMDIGGRTFRLTANPVLNDKGDRLGSVMEWMDRTAEVKVEREVAGIVAGAVKGDFTQRIELQGKEGFFLQLGEGMNKLLDTTATGLNEVQRMLAALAQGDLNQRITAEFEGTFGQLKDDANSTAEKLKEIVLQIKGATDAINTASKEIAAGNADLSQRTEEQASSLEETASSMEELTSTVKQNAENAKQANQLAKGASEIAVKGGDVVGSVVGTMAAINDSSRKIVDIISVIDGIAFQTNILALNAAVEAARAGEQGRGFAVVAGEVRNLAQRSAAAAKEIKTLIGDSVEKVEGGTKLVEEAGKTMEEIVTAVKRVTDIMSEISAASLEQSSGIEQVNQAITQMDEVTQQNAALVEEAAAAAESMEEQAQSLATAVSVFRVNDDMAAVAPVRAHAPAVAAPASAKAVAAPKRAPKAAPPAEDDWAEF